MVLLLAAEVEAQVAAPVISAVVAVALGVVKAALDRKV
jgi:tetrahydromethanopterin S-methyltransferase subunit C